MKYKFSKYNHFVENGESTILFNSLADSILILSPQLTELIYKYIENPVDIKGIHLDLFNELKNKNFIVFADKDETQYVINKFKEEDNSPKKFSMIINPTMDCNLRCWYCYEKHVSNTAMSKITIEAIKKLIEKKTNTIEMKHLEISFFGGEPLLQFKRVVKPILEYAREKCVERKITLHSSFTTNAVLLNDEIINWLQPINKKCSIMWQITLDGNREIHDKSRITTNHKPTFDNIIKNIKKLILNNMYVNVRLNYSVRSLYTFVDILDEFEELTVEQRKLIHFDFQQIWQEQESDKEDVKEIKRQFQQENFNVALDAVTSKFRCYADRENSIVINYSGDLYKCTARDFNEGLREGVLSPDGDLIWNNLFYRRMIIKYGNETCHACSIYPICAGGCSQGKLEIKDDSQCIKKMSQEDKMQIIVNRIKWILDINKQ